MRHAIVLAGGGGTRLWPASRRQRPKQFLPLGPGGTTLLAACARRAQRIAQSIWIVTAEEQAPAIPDFPGARVLTEPAARNTAAAVGLAAVHAAGGDPDAILAVLPADQHIGDEDAFARVAEEALALAAGEDAIVTIGIRPTRPETGFGWLELAPDGRRVERFTEKPDRKTAEAWLAAGTHLWNGGMFFFRATRILAELRRHMPETGRALDEIAAALPNGPAAADEATRRVYPGLPPVSIDYGVMERARGISALPGEFGWNDVGTWPAVATLLPADDQGNRVDALVAAHDSGGNIVVADEQTLVALVGVRDLVVVKSGNAILVVPRDRAQDVKEIVAQLERRRLEPYL